MTQNEKLISFLDRSPSAFHAVDNLKKMLDAGGFTERKEYETWSFKPGGKYYVTRNGSALIAFCVPEKEPSGVMICSAHSDSPSFKIKPNCELDAGGFIRLSTERYGGMIYSTWLDRPLSVAGRLVLRRENGIEVKLVSVERDLLVIPNVAIHMNREINNGFSYNPAVDLVPLYASADGKNTFVKTVAEAAGEREEDVIDYDLTLYNRQRATVWGHDGEFFSSARIDDLQCAFSAVEALTEMKDSRALSVAAVFDNEEVGSLSKAGADSTFLDEVLSRVCDSLYGGRETLAKWLASGMMLSADNAHAVHPNHPEYADPTNRPKMNGGVVIKYSANQKYTSDAVSAALFEEICRRAGVETQRFTNRSDMVGGSTLGNIANSHLSLNTVDIGCAQLAMHSSYETAGTRDTDAMIRAMKAFYETSLTPDGEFVKIEA